MTLLGSVVGPRNGIENPAVPLTSTSLLEWLGHDSGTSSGKNVTETTALGMPAVWRGLTLSAGIAASLPLHAYTHDGETRQRATGWGADLLDDPHPDMTDFDLWETVHMHRRGWGNAYLRKLRGSISNNPIELWPIHPSRVRVGRESEVGRKVYSIDGGKSVLSDNEILHLPGIGYDGVCGVSPIRVMRQAIGLGLAAEEFGARLFGNGSLASGILQTEQRLTNKQATDLSARWKAKNSGLNSAHETVVLDRGAKFMQLTIPPEDAQFLESRRFQISEACRMLGVPPFLMFETEKSTSWGTGLEQQVLGWVKFDLRRDLVAVEKRLTKHLLRPLGQYAHYSIEGLLRGDSTARSAFYTAMWNLGVYSTDEIRAMEEMGPVEGGDVRYRPLNMGRLGDVDTDTTTTEEVGADA